MKLYSVIGSITTIIYTVYRLTLIVVSMGLILIPTNSSNSVSFMNSSVNTNLKKQKAERQLLYLTIFISIWKTINIITEIMFNVSELSMFTSSLMTFISDFSGFISNIGAVILLPFMSNIAKTAFRQAFRIKKDEASVSTVTITTVSRK